MQRARSYLWAMGIAWAFFVAALPMAWADSTGDSHDAAFDQHGLLKADVATLKDTQLVPHPDMPLAENENVLWCDTLQLAWNEAISLVGEKLHFTRPSAEADLLNREAYTKDDLDAGSYVAIADFERNNVEGEIEKALQETFRGAASPTLIPPRPEHPGPDDFVAYAYLFKDLTFAHPFAENAPLSFQGKSVQNFGFMAQTHNLDPSVTSQVRILNYSGPDNFVIELETASPDDQLILAKVKPQATLEATMESVLARAQKKSSPSLIGQLQLAVPKLNFDLLSQFPELLGLVLDLSPKAHVHRLVISSIRQDVRFQLNQRGAVLKSEAEMTMGETAMEPLPQLDLIFDQPFLILLKRTSSAHPYFALWVGNASLLVPSS